MQILHINVNDVVGGRFSGFNMSKKLDPAVHISKMMVWNKVSTGLESALLPPSNFFLRQITNFYMKLTNRLGFDGLLNFGSFLLPFYKTFKVSDILHLHIIHVSCNFNILSLPLLTRLKPTVWTIHDCWPITGGCEHFFDCPKWRSGCKSKCQYPRTQTIPYNMHQWLHWKVKKIIYKHSKFDVVVASQWMHDKVSSSPLFEGKKIHLIPFGVDLSFFKSNDKKLSKRKLGIPNNQMVICFRDTAQDSKFKGMDYLIESLRQLDINIPITLLIVENGKNFLQLNNKYLIKTIGWVDGDNLVDAFSAADIFVMPSIQESFGMMAIEAMACGTPVIAFDGTALPLIIKSGGLIVPSKDISALTLAIKKLIVDDQLRIKLSANALEIANNYFDETSYIDKLLKLYQSVIDKHEY